ncbi:MAG TPA: GGDEF domain-containing protein [Baekduia sp.]|nr:GGDEF domain-containing protein [Baekduia sp.]
MLLPVLGFPVIFTSVNFLVRRTAKVELAGLTVIGSNVLSAATIVLVGHVADGSLGLLVISLPMAAGLLSDRALVAHLVLTIATMAAVALIVAEDAVRANPPTMLLPAALSALIAFGAAPLRRSSFYDRGAATVDPLTSLFNRATLASRCEELAHQTRMTGRPVAVIVCDLDHFKQVNDRHGHAAGDAVLVETAKRLREHLRGLDLAYRLGGEEFVILLPDTTLDAAEATAERLAAAVRDAPVGEILVTASFGVATSEKDEAFDFAVVFERADGALYDAKNAGRDRVRARPAAPQQTRAAA